MSEIRMKMIDPNKTISGERIGSFGDVLDECSFHKTCKEWEEEQKEQAAFNREFVEKYKDKEDNFFKKNQEIFW